MSSSVPSPGWLAVFKNRSHVAQGGTYCGAKGDIELVILVPPPPPRCSYRPVSHLLFHMVPGLKLRALLMLSRHSSLLRQTCSSAPFLLCVGILSACMSVIRHMPDLLRAQKQGVKPSGSSQVLVAAEPSLQSMFWWVLSVGLEHIYSARLTRHLLY